MMNGTAMNVDVESTRDDLAAFYSEALIARGYVINREEAREERVTITASEGGNPASKMAVSVTSYDDPSKFTLVFVKFRTS